MSDDCPTMNRAFEDRLVRDSRARGEFEQSLRLSEGLHH